MNTLSSELSSKRRQFGTNVKINLITTFVTNVIICNKCNDEVYFQISEIVISDIQNNYSGYQKLCQKGVLFEISKKVILDIQNNNFGYPKKTFISYITILFRISRITFWISEKTNKC